MADKGRNDDMIARAYSKDRERASMPHGNDFYHEIGHKIGDAWVKKVGEAGTREK